MSFFKNAISNWCKIFEYIEKKWNNDFKWQKGYLPID